MPTQAKVLVLALTLTVTPPSVLAAESNGASPRIAVVDLLRIIHESAQGKALLQKLEAEEAAKKKELRAIEVDIMALEDRIKTGPQKGLSPERINDLRGEYEQKVNAYRKQAMDAERAFNEMQNRQFGEIENLVRPILEQITKERGLDLIFDKQPSGIIFSARTLDITPEILKRLETTTTPPPPSTSKPPAKATP